MTTRATHPVAQALLGWMHLHPERLRALLEEEAASDPDDLAPAGEAAVRAHLRFVAEALAGSAAGGSQGAFERFASGLPAALTKRTDLVEAEMAVIGEASAHEASLQFGAGAGEDPMTRGMLERRVRVQAWIRAFLTLLDERLPEGSRVGPVALAWMAERQTQLADTIFAMDRRAKQAELDRGGRESLGDPAVVDRIGQAAMLQAYIRFLVEALSETLTSR